MYGNFIKEGTVLDIRNVLRDLSESAGVSGYEDNVADRIQASCPWADEIRKDALGNLIMFKQGSGPEPRPKIMFAVHMDEIGLIITKIEKEGFVRFDTIGGFDPRVLLAQEVTAHGTKEMHGVIGAKPPHVQEPKERTKSVPIEDLFADFGFSTKENAEEFLSVGDLITLRRSFIDLQGQAAAGKAMDDRASVAAVLEALQQLSTLHHQADVYAVATVQEEVGLRGATTSTYGIVPDLAIAIDVGFGDMPGLPESSTIKVGGGPGIGLGPHVHPKLFEAVTKVAKDWNIGYSVDPSPSPGGTDTFAIQVARAGVPTILFSIPLRYMHTPVETLTYSDVAATGRLLAMFTASLKPDFVEELLCY